MSASLFMSLIVGTSAAWATKLTIYTDRPLARIQPVVTEFTQKTGIEVELIEGTYPDFAARLETEGETSSADLLWVKDLVYLNEGRRFFQPLSSELRLSSAPSMRDATAGWTALTYRARTIVYNPDFVQASELSTYEDLAHPKWEKALCVRNASGTYNQALVSFLIEKQGEEKTKQILSGWMKNLAAAPFRNDTSLIEAISRGECLVGIINTYYLGMAKAQNPNLRAEIFFAEQNSGGVHTNGSGIGLLKTAEREPAEALIEFLMTPEIQVRLADANFEFPAAEGVAPSTWIRDWGNFLRSGIEWSTLAPHQGRALELMSEVGYQ